MVHIDSGNGLLPDDITWADVALLQVGFCNVHLIQSQTSITKSTLEIIATLPRDQLYFLTFW